MLHAKSGGPEASSEDRLESAVEYIDGQSQQVAIYTKGLVCSSCGIGLRIHLKKVDGIDKKQFDKGVFIDAEKQLVIVAFKEGATPDVEAVREAIYNAGYDPAHYYVWTGAEVAKKDFAVVAAN